MAAPEPEPPEFCQKCGHSMLPAVWDETLRLWRARCGKKTEHPVSGKLRPSQHEAFCAGRPMEWVHELVIPAVKDFGMGS